LINDELLFPGRWTLDTASRPWKQFANFGGINQRNAISQLPSVKPMVSVGNYSYSLYLWHWPFIVFAFYCPMAIVQSSSQPLLCLSHPQLPPTGWLRAQSMRCDSSVGNMWELSLLDLSTRGKNQLIRPPRSDTNTTFRGATDPSAQKPVYLKRVSGTLRPPGNLSIYCEIQMQAILIESQYSPAKN